MYLQLEIIYYICSNIKLDHVKIKCWATNKMLNNAEGSHPKLWSHGASGVLYCLPTLLAHQESEISYYNLLYTEMRKVLHRRKCSNLADRSYIVQLKQVQTLDSLKLLSVNKSPYQDIKENYSWKYLWPFPLRKQKLSNCVVYTGYATSYNLRSRE